MGFLDGLFGNPAKIEQQGDQRLAAGQPFEALGQFQQALRKVGEKDPVAKERLGAKVRRARQTFRRMKIEEAGAYLDDDLLEEAADVLGVLKDHADDLTPAETGEIESLQRRLDQRYDELEGRATIATPDAGDADPGRIGVRSYADPQEGASGELDLSFEQFLGALPVEDQSHAQTLGAAFRRGFVALQTGQPEAALDAFREAAEEHGGDGLVLESLAVAHDLVGQGPEARGFYEQALAADPLRRNARIALAAIHSGVEATQGLQAFGRLRQAIERFQQQGGRGEFDGAVALLREGIERDADWTVNYLIAAAEIALIHGRPREALAFAEQAQQSGQSGAPSLWHLLATAAELSGDLDRAEDAYDRATRLGGQAMFFRAEFAEFALRHKRALEDAEKIIFETCIGCQATQVSPEELDYYGILLSRIQFARGQYKAAREGVDRLLRKGPPPVLQPVLEQLRAQIQAALQAGAANDDPSADEEAGKGDDDDERDGGNGDDDDERDGKGAS